MNLRPKPRKFMVAVLASGVGASLAVEACSSNGLPGAPVAIGVPPALVDGGDASDDAANDAADAGAPGDAAAKG